MNHLHRWKNIKTCSDKIYLLKVHASFKFWHRIRVLSGSNLNEKNLVQVQPVYQSIENWVDGKKHFDAADALFDETC